MRPEKVRSSKLVLGALTKVKKPKKVKITEDELLAEMMQLDENYMASQTGVSVRDLCQQTGLSHDVIIDRLRELSDQGKLWTGWRRSTNVVGRSTLTPIYRMKGK